jgi:hypothetical protein
MIGQRSAGASVPALLLSTEKVTASHRSRDAYVYVRQSTPSQMIHHTESLARQYELRERAVMLGWPAHQVVVIDADLGRSGAQTAGRTGFKELVADVGLGKVGIVLGIEVSRLARNNADWYQLLDLCAITDTLIADADGVYHPADFNDRLVLGLKGTMSEAELHLIRSRLTAGLKHKAAKVNCVRVFRSGWTTTRTTRWCSAPTRRCARRSPPYSAVSMNWVPPGRC